VLKPEYVAHVRSLVEAREDHRAAPIASSEWRYECARLERTLAEIVPILLDEIDPPTAEQLEARKNRRRD
jgi:hypothetical protein